MNNLCAAIGQAYGNYYKQLPRIRVKGRHIDLISEHYAIEIINCDDHYVTFLDAVYNDKIEKKVFTSIKDLTDYLILLWKEKCPWNFIVLLTMNKNKQLLEQVITHLLKITLKAIRSIPVPIMTKTASLSNLWLFLMTSNQNSKKSTNGKTTN